jgi:effector-binding domain-containing protein
MRKSVWLGFSAALFLLLLGAGSSRGQDETGGQEEMGPLNKVAIKNVPTFVYCSISYRGRMGSIAGAIRRTWQFMENQDIAPTGPALAVYFGTPGSPDSEDLEWEVGFPVTPQVLAQPPLHLAEWTYTTVAESSQIGPLDSAGETYTRIIDWISAQGYVKDGPILEMLFTDPIEENPREYKTRVWVPVRKALEAASLR